MCFKPLSVCLFVCLCFSRDDAGLSEPVRELREEQELYRLRKKALGKGGEREQQVPTLTMDSVYYSGSLDFVRMAGLNILLTHIVSTS